MSAAGQSKANSRGARASLRRARWWTLGLLVLLVAAWFAAGIFRSADLARSYFAGAHDPAQELANVTVGGASPAIPPFWQVSISGDVIEPGQMRVSYRSHMLVWVEPLTGFAFANGAG